QYSPGICTRVEGEAFPACAAGMGFSPGGGSCCVRCERTLFPSIDSPSGKHQFRSMDWEGSTPTPQHSETVESEAPWRTRLTGDEAAQAPAKIRDLSGPSGPRS